VISPLAKKRLTPTRRCPICGRDNARQPQSPFSHAEWRLKTCARCGLLYLENPLPYEELKEDYAWTKTMPREASQRAARRRFTGWLRRTLKRARLRWLPHPNGMNLLRRFVGRGKVLDVGCGSGALLREMDDAFIPCGIEIDKRAAEEAIASATGRGGWVHNTDALTGLHLVDAGQFDGVVMRSYLEHEIKPLEVLRAAARVLRPDGVLIIKVPNFDCWNRHLQGSGWPGFRLPDHVNYFTPKTIRQIVARADLHVARFNLLDHLPTSDNLWLVARKAA
jgi:SAM-dependent methyltransferase